MGRRGADALDRLGLLDGRAAPRRWSAPGRSAEATTALTTSVLGIVGWSGSGKTTLLTRLIPLLRNMGLRVSTVKHTHHGFDMDRSGKDTYRHRQAGAHEVLVVSGTRWALLHELVGPEPGLPDLLARMEPVDLVLVEGYKTHPFPKLEVHRPSLGKPPIWRDQSDIVAVASDIPVETDRTRLPLNDPAAVAAWVLEHHNNASRGVRTPLGRSARPERPAP